MYVSYVYGRRQYYGLLRERGATDGNVLNLETGTLRRKQFHGVFISMLRYFISIKYLTLT